MAGVSGMFVQKNRQNPSVLLKVTIDNVGVPFLRHSVCRWFGGVMVRASDS